MGILKNITDEYFGKTKREEENIKSNIKYLKPIDMGGSVLWANRDFIVKNGGNFEYGDFFQGSEVKGMKFERGWRVPTVDEFLELFFVKGVIKVIKPIRNHTSYHIYFEYGKNELYFKISGFRFNTFKELLYEGDCFIRWTSDTNDKNKTYVFDCNYNHEKAKEIKNDKTLLYDARETGDYFPVRLVKDK